MTISQQFKESVEGVIKSAHIIPNKDNKSIREHNLRAFTQKLFLSICDNEIERWDKILFEFDSDIKTIPNERTLILEQISHWKAERKIISNHK